MNYGFNNYGCGMSSYCPTTFAYNPYGCGWTNTQASYPSYNTFGNGGSWFAIVLVVFLLLIICGCTKIC